MMMKTWALLYPMLRWLALALLIALLMQAMPFDPLAILFAGDIVVYLEIATAVWLAAQVTRVRWAAAYARFVVQRTTRRARVRARRAARRRVRLRPPSNDEEGGAVAYLFAYA